ncbi:hypothetical protein [Rubrivirga sp.]|uniref:hypothetical protein n=1 Tax=Rubrivirga sp. TaxID=1885344 RepID=UPI003B51DDD9
MRALLLPVLVVATASAQDVRVLPAPPEREEPVTLADRCGTAVPMPTPFENADDAAIRAVPLGGPDPAPMPNLCDGPAPLAARLGETDPAFPFARPPVRRYPLRPPPFLRFREPAPDLLGLPPVAPPGERE